MIAIDVGVAHGVGECAGNEIADVCEHVREEGIGSDVEGHAEPDVTGALVEEAVERALFIIVIVAAAAALFFVFCFRRR